MQAKEGDRVKVHYTLKDADGHVVESTYDTAPIEFIIGEERVIKGFEINITGMSPGEKKSIVISPAEGYGSRDESRIFEFDRKNAPGDFDPPIGQTVRMHRPDGKIVMVTVVGKTGKGFRLDANHPLAGKELNFDLELIEIMS